MSLRRLPITTGTRRFVAIGIISIPALAAVSCKSTSTTDAGAVNTTAATVAAPGGRVGQLTPLSPNGTSTTQALPEVSPLDTFYSFRSEHLVTCSGPSTPVRATVGLPPDGTASLHLDGKAIPVPKGGSGDIEADVACDGQTHTLRLTLDTGSATASVDHVLPTTVIGPAAKGLPPPELSDLSIDHEARHCPSKEQPLLTYATVETTSLEVELDGVVIPGVTRIGAGSFPVEVRCEPPYTRVITFALSNEDLKSRSNHTLIRVPA